MRLKGIETSQHILCLKHVPSNEFLLLLASTMCFIGNSSAGVREAGAFGTPVINIGSRQKARVCGENVMHMPVVDTESLVQAITTHGANRFEPCRLYGQGDAVEKMVRALGQVDYQDTQKQYYTGQNASLEMGGGILGKPMEPVEQCNTSELPSV